MAEEQKTTFLDIIEPLLLSGLLEISQIIQLVLASKEYPSQLQAVTKIDLSKYPNINNASLTALVGNCPNLKYIDLTGCNQLTDASLTALAQNCQNLEHINLTRCNQITDKAIEVLANKCQNLEHINLSFLNLERDKQTSEYWSKLFKKMPNLKSCLLPHGELISEAEINELQSQQIPDSTVSAASSTSNSHFPTSSW